MKLSAVPRHALLQDPSGGVSNWGKCGSQLEDILLMEEILHQLIYIYIVHIPSFTGFYTSQVVQDFFHQQYLGVSKYPRCLAVSNPICAGGSFSNPCWGFGGW